MEAAAGNYLVRWKDSSSGCWQWAKHDKAPNKGQRCHFQRRKQAKQWITYHRYMVVFPLEIIHPDGTQETINA